ncbi:MAG TPA: alginate lyase family protein [Longimicrobiales bacterium]|nr:alginate lyase family protein [Longimicrobiales bacterium]
MSKPISNLRGLTPLELIRLTGWKARQRAQHAIDRRGGNARLERRAAAWAKAWRRSHGSHGMEGWLRRPGAGELWFEHADPEAWAAQSCTPEDIELADASARGVFDLIGSGPVDLGATPDWRRDLYTGREWPLLPSAGYPLARGDGSDIRTVWELSRCYHFIALARAWATTRDSRYVEAFVLHVDSFESQNPIGEGPHWASPMDVAIRAANWTLAIPLFAGARLPIDFQARMLGNLWASGRYVERHLEWHPVYRGNHFIANAVGLTYLGVLFRDSRDGRRWLAAGSRHLQHEILYQVGDDGVSFEGSLAYHRLVTELFAYGGELLRRNVDDFDESRYDERLSKMHAFIGAYSQPDGRAPMIGDADDGRLHAMSAAALREPRRHALGLPPGHAVETPPDGSYSYPQGGFHVIRHGDDHAVIRCGRVGLHGAGSHDHNDQLGFELVCAGRRIIADSGTYAYTRDLQARHAYRSVAAHSVVQLGDEEPNPIAVDSPWRVLEDRTRSRCVIHPDGTFEGEHTGFAHRPSRAVWRRELSFYRESNEWLLMDTITGAGEEDITWRLHLTDAEATLLEDAGAHRIRTGDVELHVVLPQTLSCELVASEGSDAYGVRLPRTMVVVRGRTALPVRITCRVTHVKTPAPAGHTTEELDGSAA